MVATTKGWSIAAVRGFCIPSMSARNRSVVEEVLTFISRRREWAGKTSIQRSLAQNPRTPVAIAIRIVPKLSVRDLRDLGRDKNIPDAVRTLALRLYRIKRQ